MSKTLKMTVSFPMTLVVNTESVKEFQEAREEARKILADGTIPLKGESKYRVEVMASDKSDEAVLEIIYRQGIRSLVRKELLSELCGSEATARVGDIKVAYEVPMVPRSCQGCIKTECTLDARLTNSGCQFKTTGLREACGGPRWTETV